MNDFSKIREAERAIAKGLQAGDLELPKAIEMLVEAGAHRSAATHWVNLLHLLMTDGLKGRRV